MRHLLGPKDIEDVMNANYEHLLVSSSGNNQHKSIKLIVNLMRGWEFVTIVQDKESYRGPSFFEASRVYNQY